ncbi:hypothetical protein HanIR_Chr05g0228091 [Helianthus annuus]|nr:hypothetical protein HanIR_Chr05g0228091 [Helianthus annuus]
MLNILLHLLMWVMFFSLWLPSYCSLFTGTRCKVLGMLVVLMFIPIYERIIWGLAIASLNGPACFMLQFTRVFLNY